MEELRKTFHQELEELRGRVVALEIGRAHV